MSFWNDWWSMNGSVHCSQEPEVRSLPNQALSGRMEWYHIIVCSNFAEVTLRSVSFTCFVIEIFFILFWLFVPCYPLISNQAFNRYILYCKWILICLRLLNCIMTYYSCYNQDLLTFFFFTFWRTRFGKCYILYQFGSKDLV